MGDSKNALINEKTAINIFQSSEDADLFYSTYYNGLWSYPNRLTPEDSYYYDIHDMSQPDVRGVVHFVYERCNGEGGLECDLFLRTWSQGNGFSSINQLTYGKHTNFFQTDSVKISSSTNTEHAVVAWIQNISSPIEYVTFTKGEWSAVKTIGITVPEGSSVNSVGINNNGGIALAYYNDIYYHMLYYNGSWDEVSVTEEGYPFVILSSGDVFMITVADNFETTGRDYNITIFDNGVFTPFAPKSIRPNNLGAFPYSYSNGELVTLFFSSTGGVHAVFLNGTSWDYLLDMTWAGAFGCEEYEKSRDCLTETWCSDGVDNDGDGLYDSDDLDCA